MSQADAIAEPASEEIAERHLPKIHGQTMELPEDLYIPPDALEVFLDAFEGPLDLLLYLIRRQNLNILDIPVLRITQQYMQYIALMTELKLELAGEYLVMAALLAEIKSRILLPRPVESTEEEGDPRMELVRRLQEYERFKTAAENLERLPRVGRELHVVSAKPEEIPLNTPLPQPSLNELLLAFRDVLMRAQLFTRHQVTREPLSVRERMTQILALVQDGPKTFYELTDAKEGRAGVVVCLLAILELVKLAVIDLVQEGPFADIMIDAGRVQAVDVEEASEYE